MLRTLKKIANRLAQEPQLIELEEDADGAKMPEK